MLILIVVYINIILSNNHNIFVSATFTDDESALHEYDGSSIPLPRGRHYHNHIHSLEWSPSHVGYEKNYHFLSQNSLSQHLPPLPFTDTSRSRSSQPHVVRRTHLPRRDVYSKEVRNLQRQHSTGQRMHEARNPKLKDVSSSTMYSQPSTGAESSLTSSTTPDFVRQQTNIDIDTALSRLRLLCKKINEGESPQRSEIKEVVAECHHSRHQSLSPSNPNFVPIPSEYSKAKVLTHGMARSQHHDVTPPQPPFPTDTSDSKINATAFQSRSKFAELKHEGEGNHCKDSLLHSVIVLGREDDDVSCISFRENMNKVD